MRVLFIVLLFVAYNTNVYSQDVISIKGSVTSNGLPLSDAIIIVSGTSKTVHLLSNDRGTFEIHDFHYNKADSLEITITRLGYRTLKKNYQGLERSNIIDIELESDSAQNLQEVVVEGSNVVNTAGKTLYHIDSKDFIKNAKSNVALQSLPNLAITNEGVVVDNHKKALVFIDGVESTIEELYKLNISDISTVEVISNPSTYYGANLLGAVLNINTKEKNENFFKGEIETFAGARIGLWGISPTISYKDKAIIFKAFYGYTSNNQNIENDLWRSESDGNTFSETRIRNVNGWQDYLNAKMKINISKRSSWITSGNMFRYKFSGASKGSFQNNSAESLYKMDDKEVLDKWFLSSIYNYEFNEKIRAFAKFKYFYFTNQNSSNFFDDSNEQPLYTNIVSKTKEVSSELIFENDSINVLKFNVNYFFGYKNILRNFSFYPTEFKLRQQINVFYIGSNIEFNDKLSLASSLSFDITNNNGYKIIQNYNYFLPTASLLYHFNRDFDVKFDYSRKIIRPNANNLNTGILFVNPSFSIRGNKNLSPQIRNFYEFSVSKPWKASKYLSFKMFKENINNSIIETYLKEDDTLYLTYENAAKSSIVGASIGLTTKILKYFNLNINTGIDYNDFSSGTDNSLIKRNRGTSFNSSIYLNAIIKQKVSLSLFGSYHSPKYNLISKSIRNPMLNLEAESTFFKERLNVRLTYSDIGGLSTRTTNKILTQNFNQTSKSYNETTNLTVTLIYNFGKVFNDRFSNQVISNDDIKVK